jgi:hypothetical protein
MKLSKQADVLPMRCWAPRCGHHNDQGNGQYLTAIIWLPTGATVERQGWLPTGARFESQGTNAAHQAGQASRRSMYLLLKFPSNSWIHYATENP